MIASLEKPDTRSTTNPSRLGTGLVKVSYVAGRSCVTRCVSNSPLKLLMPKQSSRQVDMQKPGRHRSAWVYVSTFGGGLVAGDNIQLSISLDEGTTTFVGTQSATKVFRKIRDLGVRQTVHANLSGNSTLVYWPDPIICFAESNYQQRQVFELDADSSLVVVDWVFAGRVSRGERWDFESYRSRTRVTRQGKPIWIENLKLGTDTTAPGGRFVCGHHDCLASVLVTGPAFAGVMNQMIARMEQLKLPGEGEMIQSVSPLGDGVMLRLMGNGMESVARVLQSWLVGADMVLGDDPWKRKW